MWIIMRSDEDDTIIQRPFAKKEDAEEYVTKNGLNGRCEIYEVEDNEDDTDPDA